ncbi:glycosyltransferase family 4 protein [Patescibacteria group bacterium]
MKIGIDIRNIGKQRTGSEVVVLGLTKSILRLDGENEYFLFTDTGEKEVIDAIRQKLEIGDEQKNVNIISLKARNKFVWAAWAVSSYLRKNDLDIYHAEYILPFFLPKKIKAITHIHDVSFVVYRKLIKWSDALFLNTLIPLSIKRANKIVAVSEFTKKEIIRYYNVDPQKVEIVYNAVNKSDEEVQGVVGEELRRKYGLPEKYILYIGTLQPRKNVANLIQAYANIKDRIPGIKLVIAGNKKAHNFDEKINKVVLENDLEKNVIFTGFVDEEDKMMMYKESHVFAYPSLYEGFGIPVLEAMAQSIPVVSSDIEPLKEVCSEACLFFAPNNLDEMSQELYNVCMDDELRLRLVNSGKERVSFFSWKLSAKKMLEIYKNIK